MPRLRQLLPMSVLDASFVREDSEDDARSPGLVPELNKAVPIEFVLCTHNFWDDSFGGNQPARFP